MSNVIVDKQKIDILANAIANKSGVPVTMTLDEMKDAVDSIETGGGEPNLQAKTYTVDSAGTEAITADSGYDGLSNVAVNVPSMNDWDTVLTRNNYTTISGVRYWKPQVGIEVYQEGGGWIAEGACTDTDTFYAVASNTSITPTESAQTIGGQNYMMEGAVTINPIPSQYIIPSGSQTISQNGTVDVTSLAEVVVAVSSPAPTIRSLTVTPSESQQTFNASGVDGYKPVTVNAISSTYVGSGITRRSSTDMTVSGGIVTAPAGYYASASSKAVPNADPYVGIYPGEYYTDEGGRKWHVRGFVEVDSSQGDTPGYFADGRHLEGEYANYNAVPANTTVTPSTSAQTIGGANYMMEGAVTVNPIPSQYIIPSGTYNVTGSGTADVTNYASISVPSGSRGNGVANMTKTSSSLQVAISYPDATSGFYSSEDVSFPGTAALPLENKTATPTTSQQTITPTSQFYYLDSVTIEAMPTGTAGTPTATKGTVSNHAISVTPSVTNTTGYITGSTKTGTAVSVSASELVSGSQTITQNGTVDVTNLASVTVAVEGGGGSGVQTDDVGVSVETPSSSIAFTGLKGEPTSFVLIPDSNSFSTASPPNVIALVFDGTTIHGQTASTTSNANASYDTGFTKSYSNGTLTITATTARFGAEWWDCEYTYGGSSANIDTKDVQVGSGATSITFTGLDDEPILWSCIFKSNFGTSSGYQRVMFVRDNRNTVWGYCLDSSVHGSSAYWTSSYSNGSLTITSSGTNAGGYFHQPGYYQLTAVYGGEIEPTEIEVEPLSVTQNGTYTAPTGTAYSPVTVNVPTGGGVNVATTTWTNSSSTATSHTFTGLLGTPKAAFLRCTSSLSRSSNSSNYFVADMRWTGTATAGNSFRRSNGTYANVTSGYSFSANGTSLTVSTSGTSTSNPGSFYNGGYELTYVY